MTSDSGNLDTPLLVVRFLAGDDDAFRNIVERFHGRLGYYVRRICDDPHTADDVLQNVWLTVFEKLATLRDPGAFSTWLYRVARTAALQTLRSQPKWESIDDPVATADDGAADLGDFDAAEIHAGLASLAPIHREVLVLRWVEAMTYEEIAAVIGRPVGTVRSRIHHGRRELRSYLERSNHAESRPAGI